MSLGITTCLWFDTEAEEAANYYISIFGGDSKILHIQYYSEAGKEIHGKDSGSVLVAYFELQGSKFVALNGGKQNWAFNEAISFQIDCANQAEVDHYWEKLGEGGDVKKQQCGWLADKYGVSWQVVPKVLKDMLASKDKAASDRVNVAMMKMKKLDIAELENAFKS